MVTQDVRLGYHPVSEASAIAAKVVVCTDEVWFRCGKCESLNINDFERASDESPLVKCPDCGQLNIIPEIQNCDCECCHEPPPVRMVCQNGAVG
jgi:hypothetical protein